MLQPHFKSRTLTILTDRAPNKSNILSLIFNVLAHRFKSHGDILFLFLANHSSFYILNAVCWKEKQWLPTSKSLVCISLGLNVCHPTPEGEHATMRPPTLLVKVQTICNVLTISPHKNQTVPRVKRFMVKKNPPNKRCFFQFKYAVLSFNDNHFCIQICTF